MGTRLLLLCCISFLTASSFSSYAETIEFPDEEIATETVLPVFDRTETVKNRNLPLKGRTELGVGVGLALNEPFYNPYNFNFEGTHFFTEKHAVNIAAVMWMGGLNSYGDDLKAGNGLLNGDTFDPSLAPAPKYLVLANYQFTAYYGKISLSKSSVMNLSLFGELGLGYMGYSGTGAPALNMGIGQNFYFTKNLALRLDLRLDMFKGPDPTSQQLKVGTPAPSASAFSQILYFNTMLTAGLAYVL
jgi:outer membrane beta-barrel protein